MSRPPEPAVPRAGAHGTPCHACDSPLAADQRYCLMCGARRGAGGQLDFSGLLGAGTADAAAPPAVTPRARMLGLLRAPAPVAATMLLALLLTGIVLGSLTSPRTHANSAGRPVDVVVPTPAATITPPPLATPLVPIPAPAGAASSEPIAAATSTPAAEAAPAADTAKAGSESSSADGAGGRQSTTDTTTDTPTAALPPIKHVFMIRLGEQPVPRAFAPDPAAPYLGTKLVPAGTLLRDLRTVAGSGLADAIALLSGQGPNAQTLADCPLYNDVAPATIAPDGQEQGEGCVYSAQTPTLANQLEAQGLTWRAYVEDQAHGGPGVATSCRRPQLGAPDPWRDPRPGDAYVTARNPFVYFHAITDSPGCATRVVDLDELDGDLAGKADAVPALSYIVPNACHDGRPTPCAEGSPAGLAAADAFLARLLPKILRSKAYDDALVIVGFDRAFAAPGTAIATEGAKVGALLLSPFVRKARIVTGRYDTFAVLAAVQDIFGLDRLGHAAAPKPRKLGAGVFERQANAG